MIKNVLSKLQKLSAFFIENGFRENYSEDLKDKIRIVNFLAFFFLSGNLSEILFTHGTVYFWGSLMSILWNSMALILIYFGFHLLARILFSIFMIPLFYWMGIFVLPSDAGWQLTIQFIISSFIMIPFMILGVNERRFLYSIVLFYLISLFSYHQVVEWIDYSKTRQNLPVSYETAPALLAIMVLISFSYYQKVIRRAHHKITDLLGLTQEKNEELNQQKEEIIAQRDALDQTRQQLQKQNEDVTAGINYASRIQTAMLPETELIDNYLPQNFIFFRPRDIVSGDFYWCQERNGKVLLAVADCTGHGVPGAFMSLIGSALLDKITTEMGLISPDLVLAQLHINIRKSLHQETSDNRDGMDLVFCTIDISQKIIEFAGAKNPLVYVQNNKLTRLKGDRFPIGGRQTEMARKFQKHTLRIQQKTTFYLFSDGFQDQFGGEKDKKYMSKRFREFLKQISTHEMTEQKRLLGTELDAWMNNLYPQTDDILVVGFQL